MFSDIKEHWKSMTMVRKMQFHMTLVTVAILLTLAVAAVVALEEATAAGSWQDDYASCADVGNALVEEQSAFRKYSLDPSAGSKKQVTSEMARLYSKLLLLPDDYSKIGATRYSDTMSLKNAYENYRDMVKAFMDGGGVDGGALNDIYSAQEYIQSYVYRLLEDTVAQSDDAIFAAAEMSRRFAVLLLFILLFVLVSVFVLDRRTGMTWAKQTGNILHHTQLLAETNFEGPDIETQGENELAKLCDSINGLKLLAAENMNRIAENGSMEKKLHEEEVVRMETQRVLEETRLELLKSQVNPHFLFNTLNTISCMAKMEKAPKSDSMIVAMSNLFRYNLRTTQQIVPLAQELKVVRDYIYIQQMRFGERIGYKETILVNEQTAMIPSFTLQPLVENAYIHGLSKKEEGGTIYIRAYLNGQSHELILTVADTGGGMEQEKADQMLKEMESGKITSRGIGLGNVYKRHRRLYPDSAFELTSGKGLGTTITLHIPAEDGSVEATDA